MVRRSFRADEGHRTRGRCRIAQSDSDAQGIGQDFHHGTRRALGVAYWPSAVLLRCGSNRNRCPSTTQRNQSRDPIQPAVAEILRPRVALPTVNGRAKRSRQGPEMLGRTNLTRMERRPDMLWNYHWLRENKRRVLNNGRDYWAGTRPADSGPRW